MIHAGVPDDIMVMLSWAASMGASAVRTTLPRSSTKSRWRCWRVMTVLPLGSLMPQVSALKCQAELDDGQIARAMRGRPRYQHG
jgi:hypothetical protein